MIWNGYINQVVNNLKQKHINDTEIKSSRICFSDREGTLTLFNKNKQLGEISYYKINVMMLMIGTFHLLHLSRYIRRFLTSQMLGNNCNSYKVRLGWWIVSHCFVKPLFRRPTVTAKITELGSELSIVYWLNNPAGPETGPRSCEFLPAAPQPIWVCRNVKIGKHHARRWVDSAWFL